MIWLALVFVTVCLYCLSASSCGETVSGGDGIGRRKIYQNVRSFRIAPNTLISSISRRVFKTVCYPTTTTLLSRKIY
uniref:Putative secreted peptide n=1 Tax=Anopheles braziliensis TaxID=58242 RepID=A0A2M3ZP74_9DIPT